MAYSIRSKRLKELQNRAKRIDILWMHRRNALHCLTGVERLGEKTILWTQKLLDSCRDQYEGIEVLKEIDALQARLDRQKDLLKKRLARKKHEAESAVKAKKFTTLAPAPQPATDLW